MSILVPYVPPRRGASRWTILQYLLPRRAADLVALAIAWKRGLVTMREREILDLFVMVGTQRTGTNVLRETLCTSPDIDCRGEVFSVTENNFAAYATDNTLPRPNDYPEAEKQLLAYVKYLHATGKHGVKAFGFDIKYNQLRSIAPTYESLCALPVLVQFIKESGTRVIHVVRENVLQAALSEMVAESRAVWHHTGHEEIERKVRIDCGRLLRNMLERRADRQIFASVMEGHSRMITCEYDRLSRGLAMADAEGNLVGTDNPLFEVADFLGVKPAFRDSKKLRKIANRPYRDVIENYDEVVRLVRRTEFVTHLDTI